MLLHGMRALRAGDLNAAITALAAAARAGERKAWWPLAQAHLARGDLRRGEHYCRRALYHGAGLAAWMLLAGLRLHRDDFEGAEHAARAVLRLRPGEPAALLHLAQALLGRHRPEEAARVGRQLRQTGRDDPRTICVLARACRDLGQIDEAREILEQGLRQHPVDPWMLYERIGLNPCPPGHPLHAQARRALAESGDDEQRAILHFTLARIHEHAGDYARAFESYRDGNACTERLLMQSGQAYDRRRHAASVDAVIEHFNPRYFADRAGYGAEVEQPPVIITGVSRSGKSLLANLLSGHPLLVNLDESPVLGRLSARWGPSITAAPGADGREAAAMYARGCMNWQADKAGPGRRCLNTHPLNARLLGVLAVALPGARVIYVERDERDLLIANYCTFHKNESFAYSCNLEDCRSWIHDYARLMAHWQKVSPLGILVVRYEDLVRDPDHVTGKVLDYLGLPWNEACRANLPGDAALTLTPGLSLECRSRIGPALVGCWRHYAEKLPAGLVDAVPGQ